MLRRRLKSCRGPLDSTVTVHRVVSHWYGHVTVVTVTTVVLLKLEVVGNVEADEFIGDLRGAVLFKAQAGEALTKGEVVYISGISGNTTIVSKADANDSTKMPAFGLSAETVAGIQRTNSQSPEDFQ